MLWLAQSRKAQVAIGSILTIILTRLLTMLGMSSSDITTINIGIITIATVWIGSIAHEDASKNKAQAAPASQVNVGSDVVNTPLTPSDQTPPAGGMSS